MWHQQGHGTGFGLQPKAAQIRMKVRGCAGHLTAPGCKLFFGTELRLGVVAEESCPLCMKTRRDLFFVQEQEV